MNDQITGKPALKKKKSHIEKVTGQGKERRIYSLGWAICCAKLIPTYIVIAKRQ